MGIRRFIPEFPQFYFFDFYITKNRLLNSYYFQRVIGSRVGRKNGAKKIRKKCLAPIAVAVEKV